MEKSSYIHKIIKTLAVCMILLAATIILPGTLAKASAATSVNKGKTVSVKAGATTTVKYYGINSKTKKSVYVSSSKTSNKYTSVAKIVSKGNGSVKIKALKAGTCYVRLTYGKKTYVCKVSVKAAKSAAPYTSQELYLMSHLINGEAGCSWISDAEQRAEGSVVLNRMKDRRFPSTMSGVIYQRGQYACTWDGNFNKTPSKRVIANAKYILTHGSTLPKGVVFQSQRRLGAVYAKIGVHYFCY